MSREDLVNKVEELGPTQTKMQSFLVPPKAEDDPLTLLEEAALEIQATGWRRIEQPLPPPGDWPEYHLPHGYDQTRLVLLVRDPYWLHAYWEIGSAERETVRAKSGRDLTELPLFLRLNDLTQGESSFLPINHEARNWYIEAGRPGHAFTVEIGAEIPGQGFFVLARSNEVATPVDRVSDVLDEDWLVVEEDFARLYRLAAGLGPGQGSLEMMEALRRRMVRQMGSGAIASLMSPFGAPPQVRPFWLVVGTELIIYGATQPDAKVTVDGVPVALRPDGTFSVRYALPDGERAFPVTGTSADGKDSITITPVVRKESH
ncbi:MAG: DUF4912 domain-containing protein [Bacillota bacterium]